MILYVIAMRDRVANLYGQPVYVANLGSAIRGFGDQINDPTSPMNKHPDDYDLYELGTFDDEAGTFVNLPQPRQLALGRDLLTK
jgi:hypothetical protein